GDKAAAEEVASKIRAKLQLGEFNFEEEKPISTFSEYADSWIKTTVPANCRESTVRDYKDILEIHILPVFENLEIPTINRKKVKDFLNSKTNKGYAASTVSHMKDVISGVLNEAVDAEIIPANPAYKLKMNITKKKNFEKAIDPLTKDELKILFDTVQEHFIEHYPLFLLLARTGLRIGEALALQWGDIDFNGRFIHVQRGISRGKIEPPKNGKARKVDMSKQLAEALKIHQTESKKKGLALGLGDIPEYVFTNEVGNIIDKDNWRRRVFNKALAKARLRRIRIHDLRHTYATLRIAKGDNIQDVSKQLGHHSVKLTLDVYSHWLPGKKKDEVDALDDPEYQVQSGSVKANKK
ncbi:MAG: site-specific integrase, partial [Deltaproteobacteria bacterium]